MDVSKEKHEVSVELKVIVTGEDIDDLMASALDGGITYWCCKAEVVGEYLGEYASDQISRGGTLKLYDSEENKVYELTREKFLEGVRLYIKTGMYRDAADGMRFDVSMMDGYAADAVVQLALFGQIVFG